MNNSKITEMKKLIEQLKKANYAYYQLDEPIMSDRDYNVMYEQLEQLEKETGMYVVINGVFQPKTVSELPSIPKSAALTVNRERIRHKEKPTST